MGFISSILNPSNGAGFQAVNADTKIGPANDLVTSGIGQQQSFVNALQAQNGLANQANVFGQQQALANQLQGVANGTGPNPALAQLNQATGQNIAAQGAMMAGQRGSSANAGLLARLAAQQGGNLQQQAVGQGATLQAQQQLGAMQQLQNQQASMGNMANSQVNQQQTGLSALNQSGLQNQSNIMGLQANANSANAGIAGQNTQAQAGLLGGAMNGIGSGLMALAHGGQVPAYAGGGAAGNPLMQPLTSNLVSGPSGPQSEAGKMLSSNPGYDQMGGQNSGAQALNTGMNQLGAGFGSALRNRFGGQSDASALAGYQQADAMLGSSAMNPTQMMGASNIGDLGLMAAHGGAINGEMLAAQGKQVPGQANVPGDSLKNDTVPARLSPGEIVIPRHITMGPNAPQEAAKFVHQVLSKNMACGGQVNYADGGQAGDHPPPAPDPQKARDADINVPGRGESFAKGWENAKKFWNDPMANIGKAHGGVVQHFDEGGEPSFFSKIGDAANAVGNDFYNRAIAPAIGLGQATLSLGEGAAKAIAENQYGRGALSTAGDAPVSSQGQATPPGLPGTQAPEGMNLDKFRPQGGGSAPGTQGQGNGQQIQNPYGKYDLNAGINLQEKGLKSEADYQNKMNEGSVGKLQDLNNQMNMLQYKTQQNAWNHNLDQEKVINDIQNGHIDANAYLNNMGTGQKVSTALGLILGGMGGGLTHQENPAMKFLQSQIANDVHAQEQNINNKHNLLNALEKQYGDKQTAAQSLYNIYSMKYENEMKQMAAQNGSPLVQARLQQALGPLEQQRQQNNLQMGMRTSALNHLQSGGDAAAVIPFIVPEHQKEKALEQYGKLNELNELQKGFRESAEHLHGKFMNGVLSPNDTNSAKQYLAGAIQKVSEGRYNGDAANKLVDSMLPQTMDRGSSTYENKMKRQDEFFNAFKKEPETFLNALGVPTPKLPPRGRAVNQGMK